MTSTPDEDAGEAGFDPAARELCADGSCTGVIGDDGRCRVCGRAAGDATSAPAARSDVEEADEGAAHEGALEVEGDVAERRLCPDGSCVGLIGDDGRCKVCGLPADSRVD
jgi:hypothetical protein